ncbi:MAG: carboxypeptidase-like regulatory domain-containing protein [Lutibacter sp.]|nr:carboxypeptidase-like regulatory domain-containing protein [Lutibacter sp.]
MIKQGSFSTRKSYVTSFFLFLLIIGFQNQSYAANRILNDTIEYSEYRGKVIDVKTKKPLEYATLLVNGTNISTITNSQGGFLLKVPKIFSDRRVTVSFLGYTSKVMSLADFDPKNTIIKLEIYIEELSEVKINVKDATSLVQEMLKRKGNNYVNDDLKMTSFYRETIKKRRTYVSLSEAVVEIYKQPYSTDRSDILKIYKARKSTDYNKLDTVAFKLRGGPFTTLYLDIMKNTAMLFDEDMADIYDFTFDNSTKIDNRLIYVVNFKQKRYINEPYYYGKLYIDAQTLALTNAKFYLNLENKQKASKFFIIKKPKNAKVLPIEAYYQVEYREKDGKWVYGYSRIQLGFKINWDKKWFNSIYYSTIEMAITDWEKSDDKQLPKLKERLRPSVIMSDNTSGFKDPEFWGAYNVIEPDKPIESAIEKIQRQLKRN